MEVSVKRTVRIVWLLAALTCVSASVETLANTTAGAQTRSFDEVSKAAAAARDAGRVEEAAQLYRQGVQMRPEWAEGWWYLGTMAYDANKYEEAAPAFRKVTELTPALGTAWTFLGLCEYEQRDYGDALLHLEKGRAIGVGDDRELERVANFHIAMLRTQAGAFPEARQMLEQEFSAGAMPAQAQFVLGLIVLRIPLLPENIDPGRDGLVAEAGRLAAESAGSDLKRPAVVFAPLLERFPRTPYVHYAYGMALAAAGREADAKEEFQSELAISPESEAAKLGVGVPSEFPRISAKGAAELAAYYGARGANASTNEMGGDAWNRALANFAAKKYDDAIVDLTAVVKQRPDFGTAWAMLGLCEFTRKQYDNARVHLEKGQALGFGGSAESVRGARYHLGVLLIRDGEFERAAALLVPQAEGATLAKEIQFALGMALLRIAGLPEDVPASERAVVERAGEASILLYNSKYDLALPMLKKLAAENPSIPFLHYAYGTGLSSLSQFADARRELLDETKISPKSELPYLSLAGIELKLKRAEEALGYAQKALQLAPQSAEGRYVAGRSYLELDKFDEAISELETAARMAPSSAEVHFQLARAYAKAKQPEKAAQERETFARLNALLEERRSRQGNQAYGAAHGGADLPSGGMQGAAAEQPH
jgi:tetratricopeptide (TPR) repeat protein